MGILMFSADQSIRQMNTNNYEIGVDPNLSAKCGRHQKRENSQQPIEHE